MKSTVVITFNFGKEQWFDARQFFQKIGREDLAKGPKEPFGYTFKFPKNSHELKVFRNQAKKLGFDWLERIGRKYTFTELVGCKLLLFTIDAAPKGNSGPSYGTQYDLSCACSRCGTGAVQISSLILSTSEIPKNKDLFETLDGEVVISDKVRAALVSNKVKGVRLRPIISKQTNQKLPLFQILPERHLPPVSEISKGLLREEPCRYCGRDGYFSSREIPMELHYKNLSREFLESADVFFTYEHFGNSVIKEPFQKSHFAQPHLVVTPKVIRIFTELKVKGASFEPVVVNGFPDIENWEK